MIKYLFIIPFFFLPLSVNAGILGTPTLNVASTTHKIGFTIQNLNIVGTPTEEIRIYPAFSTISTVRTNACLVIPIAQTMYNGSSNSITIRPYDFIVSSSSNYRCYANGYYSVQIYLNNTTTSPVLTVGTIYMEQFPLDIRSTFMLMFLIGGLLAILRPLILKLTLK